MREFLQWAALALGLAAFGLFAWMMRNPDAAWIEEAEAWPLVGPAAEQFRRAYLGPDGNGGSPAPGSGGEPGVDEPIRLGGPIVVPVEPEREPPPRSPVREPLDLRSMKVETTELPEVRTPAPSVRRRGPALRPREPAIPSRLALDHRWVLPGQPLWSGPEGTPAPEGRADVLARVPVFDRRGERVLVAFRGADRWVDEGWEPGHSRRKAHRGLLRHRFEKVRASDSGRLEDIREHLGIDRPERRLGAYVLYTDVEDDELLALLDAAATAAESAYFARYARLPAGDPERTVVLFAREADYRRYSEDSEVCTFRHAGHAGGGILAFYAEGRRPMDLAGTLVHEIVHLLNTRALTRFLPPWLQEGIASDLGSVRFETADGAAAPSVFEHRILRLAATLEEGELPPSAALMVMEPESFYRPETTSWAYSHAGALVRYLMTERHRAGFRSFLGKVAAGFGADNGRLLDEIGVGVEQLDEEFRRWVLAEARSIASSRGGSV